VNGVKMGLVVVELKKKKRKVVYQTKPLPFFFLSRLDRASQYKEGIRKGFVSF